VPESKILIVADPQDIHGRTVAHEIERLGGRAIFFNTASFPSQWTVSFEASQEHLDAELFHSDYGQIRLSEIAGVWWRRPQPYGVEENIQHPSFQSFARGECEQTVNGVLMTCGRNVINPPHSNRRASRKLLQLLIRP
jgi:hypothetical protein